MQVHRLGRLLVPQRLLDLRQPFALEHRFPALLGRELVRRRLLCLEHDGSPGSLDTPGLALA